MTKVTFLAKVLVAGVLILTACSNKKDEYVGAWRIEEPPSFGLTYAKVYKLESDGTGTYVDTRNGYTIDLKWELDGDYLIIDSWVSDHWSHAKYEVLSLEDGILDLRDTEYGSLKRWIKRGD